MNADERREILRRAADKALVKEAFKEAAKEWLNDQFAAFGKWTAIGIASGTFYIIAKLAIKLGYWPN